MSETTPRPIIVIASTRSMGLAILLTLLFGSLGLLYASIAGALVMLVVSLLVGFATFGLGWLITWPVCVIWSMVAVSAHDNRLNRQALRS